MRVLTLLSILLLTTKAAVGLKQLPASIARKTVPTAPRTTRSLFIHPLHSSSTTSLQMVPSAILHLRGGAELVSMVSSSLQSGPWGTMSLWGIASAVVLPFTMIRQAYSFTVGYGYSVFVMGLVLLLTFYKPSTFSFSSIPYYKDAPFLLATSLMFYGFRLGSFLWLRNAVNANEAPEMKKDNTRRLKRIPLALSVAFFFAFLTTPALYALRSPPDKGTAASIVSYSGVALAWLGAILEAVADGHKFVVKLRNKDNKKKDDKDSQFVGPTSGVYRICRHPNYLGEILFWSGQFVGGLPSFGNSAEAWVYSLVGLFGILNLMKGATKRLDDSQAEKYQGQETYEAWKTKVTAPLVPFISSERTFAVGAQTHVFIDRCIK